MYVAYDLVYTFLMNDMHFDKFVLQALLNEFLLLINKCGNFKLLSPQNRYSDLGNFFARTYVHISCVRNEVCSALASSGSCLLSFCIAMKSWRIPSIPDFGLTVVDSAALAINFSYNSTRMSGKF